LIFEKRLAQRDLEVAGREKSIPEREAALSKEKDSLETQINERMQQERGKIAADEAKKAKLALSNDIEQKTKEVSHVRQARSLRCGDEQDSVVAQSELGQAVDAPNAPKQLLQLRPPHRMLQMFLVIGSNRINLGIQPPRGDTPHELKGQKTRHRSDNVLHGLP